MIKVDHQNCGFDSFFTRFPKSDAVLKKARQRLYILQFKHVPAYRLEHFRRPQRRERKLHANMYAWFCHVFLTVFGRRKQKTDYVSRNLIVLLRWGPVNAIQTNAFSWTSPQKLIPTNVSVMFVCISISIPFSFHFHGHSDEKRFLFMSLLALYIHRLSMYKQHYYFFSSSTAAQSER